MNPAKPLFRLLAVLFGAVLFHILFWNEGMGINVAIHFVYTLVCYFIFYKESFSNHSFKASLAGTIVILIALVFHNSAVAQVFYWFSFILTLGFAHGVEIKTIMYAIPRLLYDFFIVPKELFSLIKPSSNMEPALRKSLWFFRISIVPIALSIVFLIIYSNSNDLFGTYVSDSIETIARAVEIFFEKISFPQAFFFGVGLLLSTWIIQSSMNPWMKNAEFARKVKLESTAIFGKMPIAKEDRERVMRKFMNENASGTLMMVFINTMLLGLNLIDISNYWFSFDSSGINLTQFVHEGTYLLILSVLLSMAIMLYYFRGFQNFSEKHPRLSLLAYVWIFQNAILVFSVGIRNFHYIDQYALAYKRIGVFFFLLIVLFGLYTLYLKISGKKTGFFLLKLNSWSTYFAFVLVASFNWDGIITRYNFGKAATVAIDAPFILNMSDKTLPLIHSNIGLLDEEQISQLHYRIHTFMEKRESQTWLSWNYLNNAAHVHFKENPIPPSENIHYRSADPDLILKE